MSYQVGKACYASKADAGSAACVAFSPVTTIVPGVHLPETVCDLHGCTTTYTVSPTYIRTVSCQNADQNGALNLSVIATEVNSSVPFQSSTVSQVISFPACEQQDYVFAAQSIFGALLVVWVSVYCLNYIRKFLDWSRGDI
jgi:hypothetical protein